MKPPIIILRNGVRDDGNSSARGIASEYKSSPRGWPVAIIHDERAMAAARICEACEHLQHPCCGRRFCGADGGAKRSAEFHQLILSGEIADRCPLGRHAKGIAP